MPKNQISEQQIDFLSQLEASVLSSTDKLSTQISHIVQKIMPLDTPQDFNREIAGGVTLTKLKDFPIETLESVFTGMHNLEVSPEILKRLNPAELLSAYFAAGSNKYAAYLAWNKTAREIGAVDEATRTRLYAEQLIQLGYPKSVGDFVGVAYQMNQFSFRQKGFRFPALRMRNVLGRHERERLETVPEEDARIFTESFYAPYVPSNKQDNAHPRCFYDPNCDGNDKHLYASRIYHELKGMYHEQEKEFLQRHAAKISRSSSISKGKF